MPCSNAEFWYGFSLPMSLFLWVLSPSLQQTLEPLLMSKLFLHLGMPIIASPQFLVSQMCSKNLCLIPEIKVEYSSQNLIPISKRELVFNIIKWCCIKIDIENISSSLIYGMIANCISRLLWSCHQLHHLLHLMLLKCNLAFLNFQFFQSNFMGSFCFHPQCFCKWIKGIASFAHLQPCKQYSTVLIEMPEDNFQLYIMTKNLFHASNV